MADPISVAASLIAIVTATVQTTKSLQATIKRFNDRGKTLQRLQGELEDLTNILQSLKQVVDDGKEPIIELLQGPVQRCQQICQEFEASMETFASKLKPGLRDWAKMEFMRGDINDFIDTIEGYKSTITVALGTINMNASKVAHNVLIKYNEMIHDTMHNLELHLQRIDEKMTQTPPECAVTQDIETNLNDEREVTQQCLRICEDARSFLHAISERESRLLQEDSSDTAEGTLFSAQIQTRRALDENCSSLANIIGALSENLKSSMQNRDADTDGARKKLQSDIDIHKQCLDVCRAANEMSREKIYRVGEAIAEGNSDQVVVTTLADLFDVGKALSKDNSAQLVGSMTAEALQHLTEHRYGSRFGVSTPRKSIQRQNDSNLGPEILKARDRSSTNTSSGNHEASWNVGIRDKGLSNEVKKRVAKGETNIHEASFTRQM